MTSPVSPSETIAKAMEGVTHAPGPWEAEGTAVYCDDKTGQRVATTKGEYLLWSEEQKRAHAAYIAACNPVAMREVLDELYALRKTALQLEAMRRRAENAEALAERLKLEAQAHAMEARTANSTINEIYQVVSGGKGEPGNWHGATPVREKLEAMQREMAEMREALRPFSVLASRFSDETSRRLKPDNHNVWGYGDDTLTYGDFRRARALIQGEKK